MAVIVAELLALLKLDKKDFDKNMKDSKGEMTSFGSKMKKAGQNITDFGNKMTVATAPLALGLGIAINNSKQFNDKMANVNTILGITGDEASSLRAEILAFGAASRQGPLEVADAYYSIVSGVQDASTHMAILEASTRTADAGQADLMATTSGLVAVMNSYGFAADDAAHVSDIFTNVVGMGVLTMDELASAMPQVTGMASSMGISIDDLGGQMAFLTTQGFSAANSATFLSGMMTTLLNPTTAVADAITALGYESGEAMVDSLGLVGSYEALKTFNGGSFSGLVTSQEALKGALALTSDGFEEFNQNFKESTDGATARAIIIQDEAATWDDLSSKMQALSIVVGDELVPILDTFTKDTLLPLIDGVIAWMDENPELTQQLVLMAGAAVILGPILSGVGVIVGVVGGVVGALTTGYSAAIVAQTAFQAGAVSLSSVMLGVVAPIIAIGAAIAGVVYQMGAFSNQVNQAQQATQSALSDEFASGAVTIQDVQKTAFNATAAEFGGGFGGDLIARLTYANTANAAVGDQNIQGRAIGGGVSANTPYMVGEDGPELFVPDSSGEIMPNGSGGGGATINVYQLPGEDGMALAQRIQSAMMKNGMIRHAA